MGNEHKEGKLVFKSNVLADFKGYSLSSIDDVPIADKKAYDILVGEKDAFEFVNTVKLGEKYPAKLDPWTDIVLTEDWAKSFVKAVNKVAKPLFIGGHADTGVGYKERAIPDGYITGGVVKDEVLYLRNTLPQSKVESKQALVEQTVNEIKAGMLSTSTSDYMRYKIEVDDTADTATYFAEESISAQSNALVEEDQTGSEAEIIITSFKAGNGSDGEEKGERQMGEKTFTNVELFTSLKNQLDSGRLALSEVASKLGVDLMTSKQKAALKRLNDVESAVGNVTDFVAAIKAEREQSFAALKDAKIKEVFKTDELVEIAQPLFNLKEGTAEDIDKEVKRIADLKVFKAIQGKIAASVNGNPTGSGDVTLDEESSEVMEA